MNEIFFSRDNFSKAQIWMPRFKLLNCSGRGVGGEGDYPLVEGEGSGGGVKM